MIKLNLTALCALCLVLALLIALTWEYYATQQADTELVKTLQEIERN